MPIPLVIHPVTMYAVKPVLTRFENIELPTSMYSIKSQEFSSGDEFLEKLSKQVDKIVRKVCRRSMVTGSFVEL